MLGINKALCGASVALLMALVIAGFAYRAEVKHVQTLTLQNAALASEVATGVTLRRADKDAATARLKAAVALSNKMKEQNATLITALSASPDWSAQRVPDGVSAALGVRSTTP